MPFKVTAHLYGNALSGFPKSLDAMNKTARARLRDEAVEPTLNEIAAKARALVPVSDVSRKSRKGKNRRGPGELRETIRAEMSATDAPVGYVNIGEGKLRRSSHAATAKGKARAKSRAVRRRSAHTPSPDGAYAMVIEYGAPHRGIAARPFIRPALEGSRARFQARCETALSNAVNDADRIGG